MANEHLYNNHILSTIQIKGIKVKIIVNKRLKKSRYLKFLIKPNKYELNIPEILEVAPDDIKATLFEWVNIVTDRSIKWNKDLRVKRKELEEKIGYFISDNFYKEKIANIHPSQQWITQGCKYDLNEVFSYLNQNFFNNSLCSFVRWGREKSRTSYQKTYRTPDGDKCNLITIAGIYNRPDVPRYAIESIMFHEMLHIYLPPVKRNGRNIIHSFEFRKMERAFPYYEHWKRWLREYRW